MSQWESEFVSVNHAGELKGGPEVQDDNEQACLMQCQPGSNHGDAEGEGRNGAGQANSTRQRSRSPATRAATARANLSQEVHPWLEAASLRLGLLRNMGGGNDGLLRILEGLMVNRECDSYIQFAEPFVEWVAAGMTEPGCTPQVPQDWEWATDVESMLWDSFVDQCRRSSARPL